MPISDDLVTVSFTSGVRVGRRRFSISESDQDGLDVKEHRHSSEETGEGASYRKGKKYRSDSHLWPRYESNNAYLIVTESHEVAAQSPSLLSGQSTKLILFLLSTGVLACPSNLAYSSTLTTITIPTSLASFVSIVGDFYKSTWYSYPVISTIGPANQVGSIRTVTDNTGKLVFHDTLVAYQSNPYFFEMAYRGPGGDIKAVDYGNFVLGSYVERLTGTPTCKESAVLVTFGIDFCATNISTAKQVLIDGHIGGIQQVQTLLEIGNFTTCNLAMED